MKKILLSVCFVLCLVPVFAQVQKGDTYLGTSLALSAGTDVITTVGVGLEIGHFVSDGVRIGVAGAWVHADRLDMFGVNPNLAYYFRLADRFSYTPELGGEFVFSKKSDTAWTAYLKFVSFEVNVTKGFALGFDYGSLQYGGIFGSSRYNAFLFDFGSAGLSAKFYL